MKTVVMPFSVLLIFFSFFAAGGLLVTGAGSSFLQEDRESKAAADAATKNLIVMIVCLSFNNNRHRGSFKYSAILKHNKTADSRNRNELKILAVELRNWIMNGQILIGVYLPVVILVI